MNSREDELKQIFLAEAFEHFEALNKLFTQLEKDHQNKHCVEAIFRITHTLKANAAAMGFVSIADLSHVLEDIFSEIKGKRMEMTPDLFNDLFRANDKLGELIHAIKDGGEVRYKGMLVKLKVILSKSKGEDQVPQVAKDRPTEPEQPAAPLTEGQPEAPPRALDELNQVLAQHNQEKQAANELAEEESEEKEGGLQQKISFSDLVQVPVGKLDQLLNLVGELAIEKDRIITQSKVGNLSTNEYARLYRITSDLQYSVMSIRLVQVNVLFHKFHRIIRDVANLEGKKVDLELEGTDIEIDRSILQIISDSLIHLVRNAVSHGIEKPDKRKALGKAEAGKLRLSARNNKEHVIIEVSDDGKGIDAAVIRSKVVEKGLLTAPLAQKLTDEEIIKYIFEPGFSSAEKVTEISGRGVGMDVVKRSLDAIGGKIQIRTTLGHGTTFSLSLPSSMAVKSALLFELDQAEYAIPLSFTEAVISCYKEEVHKVGNRLVSSYLQKNISLVFLRDLFTARHIEDLHAPDLMHRSFDQTPAGFKLHVIVCSFADQLIGFVVDKLFQQKEIMEKPLGKPLENTLFVSGATILGNGKVCLVIDVPSIYDYLANPVALRAAHAFS